MKDEDIITIPNAITFMRIVLLPFFIILLVYDKIDIAILVFGVIAIGDALDGLSARIMKQKTKIGALLDSTTDWLVLLSALITFIFIKKYLLVNMIIILLIPAIGCLIAKGMYLKKRNDALPTIIGKITVASAYITTISLLINFRYKEIFLGIVVILAYATMALYIIKDVKLFIK